MKTPFVWLGSGRSRKWGVADKGRLLDMAARAGLPVPPGAILLDEFVHWVVAEGVAIITEDNDGSIHFSVPDPGWLAETFYNGIRFPRLDKRAAIRAAFSTMEAAPALSLNVDLGDPAQLTDALCQVWSAALPGTKRRDVLIMEMTLVTTAGTALTGPDGRDDEVNVTAGTAVSPPTRLPQLRTWQRPQADLPGYAQRLQQLLRGARRTLGKGDWEIEWGDDGRVCWLLQAQTLPPKR